MCFLGLGKGYRTKKCKLFDKLWNENTYEYKIPKHSFCSDTCTFSGSSPYWFECTKEIMPEIDFFFSNDETCRVMSEKGIDNQNNAACIKQVAGFLNKPSSNRVSTNKLVYITHGFGDGIEKTYLNRNWMIELKNSTLQRYGEDSSVVVGIVNWEIGAKKRVEHKESIVQHMPEMGDDYKMKKIFCCHWKLPWGPHILPVHYGTASVNTWAVGNIVAYVNSKISQTSIKKPFSTSCIGHSLGAQVCGFFGKMSQKLKITLDKIIGLDPAGPIFDIKEQDKSLRLDKDDALNVEVFHANSMMYGFRNPIGDVDFYINGGNYQYGRTGLVGTIDGKSHSMPVDFLISLNLIYFPCFAHWKCNIADGKELKDIVTEDEPELVSKSCFKTSSKVNLGDLDVVDSNMRGVYWVNVDKHSETCPLDRGKFEYLKNQRGNFYSKILYQ